MSWSRDFIWTIAIRNDLALVFGVLLGSMSCPLKNVVAPDPRNNKRTIKYRNIFIRPRPCRPHSSEIERAPLSLDREDVWADVL
jgi:hypothetical protein